MIDEKELRLALTHIKEGQKNTTHYKDALQTLLALAEAYQKVGEGLPEKKKCPVKYPDTADFKNGKLFGFDQAIDDCRLAYTKKLMSGGLEQVIKEWGGCGYNEGDAKDLAQQIVTYLTNHSEGEK